MSNDNDNQETEVHYVPFVATPKCWDHAPPHNDTGKNDDDRLYIPEILFVIGVAIIVSVFYSIAN